MVPWPGGELADPHRAQFPAKGRLARRDAKLVPEPLRQIDQPPAHHPVQIGLRSGLPDARQGRAMLTAQKRRLAGSLPVDQARRPFRVEPDHPVANDLKPGAAGPRRLRQRAAIADDSQCKKTPDLLRANRRNSSAVKSSRSPIAVPPSPSQ